jgi:hypothetical protein
MVAAEVVLVDEHGIELKIIKVLEGDETRDTIRVWDGKDFDCNGFHSMSASDIGGVNDTVLIMIEKVDSLNKDTVIEQIGDYKRPFPYGEKPSLVVKNGMINGFITGPPYVDLVRKLSYKKFIDLWEKNIPCNTWYELLSIENKATETNINFSNGFLYFENVNDPLVVYIFSATGAIISSHECTNCTELKMTPLKPGIYFIHVKSKNGRTTVFKELVTD